MENQNTDQEKLPKPELDLPLPRPLMPEHSDGGRAEKEIPDHFEDKLKLSILKSKFFLSFVALSVLIAFVIGGFALGRNSVLKELNPSNPVPPPPDEPVYEATPTPDPLLGYKLYTNKDMGISFKIPDSYCVISETNNEVRFNIQMLFGKCNPDVYLTVSNRLNTNISAYPDCSVNQDLDYTEHKDCIEQKEDINLDGINAKSHGLDLGVDNGYAIYQTEKPTIEIKMFTAGGGLYKALQNILSTFRFD